MASAKPVTMPVPSWMLAVETVEATPEVPMEMHTSPGCKSRPREASMLSPVPQPTRAPEWV